MKLHISEKSKGEGSVELMLKGELTIYSVALLNEKLKPLMKKFQNVDINISEIAKIDTAGFQILVSALKSDVKVSFEKCSEEVLNIFSFYGEKI